MSYNAHYNIGLSEKYFGNSRNKPVKSGHLFTNNETYLWSICTCRNTSRRRTCASDMFCRRSSRPARAPCTIRRRSCHGIALETHTDRRRRWWRVCTRRRPLFAPFVVAIVRLSYRKTLDIDVSEQCIYDNILPIHIIAVHSPKKLDCRARESAHATLRPI